MGMTLFLASVIASLGILAGYIQSRISPEEMKEGRRYFNILKIAVFLLILAIGLYYRNYEIAIIASMASYFEYKEIPYADYFSLGLIAGFSADILLVILPLVFLYGLPAGSAMYRRKKPYQFIVSNAAIFVLVSQLLPFLLSYA